MATLMKSSNPVLGRNTYDVAAEHAGYGPSMTISGTVNKTGILMICVLCHRGLDLEHVLYDA